MKEKHKNGWNILIIIFTNLEKYVYSRTFCYFNYLSQVTFSARKYLRVCWREGLGGGGGGGVDVVVLSTFWNTH